MRNSLYVGLYLLYFFVKCVYSQTDTLFIQNLNGECMHCLCHAATDCEIDRGCTEGYCGPFKVSRLYWIDAGRPTLPEDDPQRSGAFEDCAIQYQCAQRMVKGYLAKYGRDCDGNGVTNCEDFSLINFNGGVQCSTPLDRNEAGRNWTNRFRRCAPNIFT